MQKLLETPSQLCARAQEPLAHPHDPVLDAGVTLFFYLAALDRHLTQTYGDATPQTLTRFAQTHASSFLFLTQALTIHLATLTKNINDAAHTATDTTLPSIDTFERFLANCYHLRSTLIQHSNPLVQPTIRETFTAATILLANVLPPLLTHQ